MKKIMSFALALVMILAMSVTAFAAGPYQNLDTTKTEDQNVTAGYVAPTDNTPTVYYFTIIWKADDANNLTYTGANVTYKWDTTELKYSKETNNGEAVGWSGSAKYTVEVVNSSNADIVATTTNSNNYNLTASIGTGEVASKTLESAAKDATKDGTVRGATTNLAVSYTFQGTAESNPIEGATSQDSVNVGKITVTVNKPAAQP